jgi:AcrR family transcriptional regulator
MKGATMSEPRPDRRIQRTRDLLRSSMVSLIKERGFEVLTVQDIIDRANVGRSTFYSHFKSKDDLMKGSVEMLRSSLKRLQLRAGSGAANPREQLFAFSRALFEHAEQHKDTFAAMVGKRSGSTFQQHLHRMLIQVVREDLTAIAPRKGRDPMRLEAVVQFVAGALIGLVISWVDETRPLSVDEIDGYFRRMAIPAVDAVLRS